MDYLLRCSRLANPHIRQYAAVVSPSCALHPAHFDTTPFQILDIRFSILKNHIDHHPAVLLSALLSFRPKCGARSGGICILNEQFPRLRSERRGLIPSLSFVEAKLETVLRIIRKVPVRTDKWNPVRYRLCYYQAVVRVSVPIVHRQCGIAQQMPPAY